MQSYSAIRGFPIDTARRKAIEIIRKHEGIIRTHEALGQGIQVHQAGRERRRGAIIE